MAITYFPFDAGAGANITEDQWRKMARHWRSTGVLGGEDDEFAVSQSGTPAMSVDVAAGKAWIRGHYVESDAAVTKTLSAADVTHDRIDRVVIRADFGNNTISIEVLEGTPAASPTVPSLTQSSSTWEIGLAQVAVGTAVSSIVDADITDERPFSWMGDSPPGTILWDAGDTPPSELYEAADGSAVSRTTYRSLFARIGTTHGAGDGSTTFNKPNLKGVVPVGHDPGQTEFDTVGETGGAKTHTLTIAEMPAHSHSYTTVAFNHGDQTSGGVAGDATGSTTGSAGSGSAHNNLQPYRVLKAWVKVL